MDLAYISPLLDLFRRGEVSKDIRLLAAKGTMALRTQEQFVLLLLLTADADEEVAAAAEVTLVATPRELINWYLLRPDASDEVRAFYERVGIRPRVTEEEPAPASESEAAAEATPSEGTETFTATISNGGEAATEDDPPPFEIVATTDPAEEDAPPIVDEDPNASEDEERHSVVQKITQMNVAERIALAMKGTREERAILIRDPNKIVGASVLSSPKLSETEVEAIARMTTVSEDVIRMIGNSRAWTKNYSVVLALVKNPKTPVAMSMNFLSRMTDRDLRMLSTSRNIPEVLRVSARKKIVINK